MQIKWTIKHLNTDSRGYASNGYFEMEGLLDDGTKKAGSMLVMFGGDDLKPISLWQQTEIDAYAESLRPTIEKQILESEGI